MVSRGFRMVAQTDAARGSGTERIHVAPAATIRDDHDDTLALGEIEPGDAVAYEVTAGAAIVLHVAREFWAIPSQG